MKVLVLDEEFPFPTNTGKRTRSFNLYRRITTRCEICYLGYGEATSAAALELRAQRMEAVPVPTAVAAKSGPMFYLRLLANLASPRPYIVSSHFSRAYRDAAQRTVRRFRPDVIVCEWTPYAIYVRDRSDVRKIVSAHNVEADIWQRYFETERNPLRRWYIGEQWRKVRRFERAAMSWVDGATTVSELDRSRLREDNPDLRIEVISNGVDLEYFRRSPPALPGPKLVFTGSMDWRPNQDAARYMVEEILPIIRRTLPDVECTFVGRCPPPDIEALARTTGVRITGTVDDVRPFVERATVYVVPLRIGGGSRLKILEALAMGRPVVSTTIGAEGLDVENGRHLVLADDPRVFADAVLRLVDDPARCRELSNEGRALVEEKYGWDAVADHFMGFLREIASPPVATNRVAVEP